MMSFGTTHQSPTQAQEARVAQEQVQAAQEQARAAQEQARTAQEHARMQVDQAQRQVDRQMRDAQRRIDEAVREATERTGRTTSQVFVPPFPGAPQVPDGAVIISLAFFVMCAVIAVGLPIARAFGRRMDRRNAGAPAADVDTRARLERIEQAVDAIAVEVERISECQRFTTKVIGELRALPQPDPSVAVPDRSPRSPGTR